MPPWSLSDVPSQHGRVAVVTGANTGLGLETAKMLAEKGARVVLACRNLEKGEAALAQVRAAAPGAEASLEKLDLGDLDSVAAFASRFTAAFDRLDLLINNAGVMVPPMSRTKQGFELQMGTNHLGHFALTGRLLPLLRKATGSRVVVVASHAQRWGKIAFDDLQWEKRRYSPWAAYGQSKLANMLFALELDRRLSGQAPMVTAAHPGWTHTELQRSDTLANFFGPFFAMKPREGAMPTMRAALDPSARGGSYYGPSGLGELRGDAVEVSIPAVSRDAAIAARLFDESERLTAVSFGLAPATRAA